MLNYARYDTKLLVKKVDSYDLIHYYLGAKYFEELGYYNLYDCALLVDDEHGKYNPKIRYYRSQDAERGYRENVRCAKGSSGAKKSATSVSRRSVGKRSRTTS